MECDVGSRVGFDEIALGGAEVFVENEHLVMEVVVEVEVEKSW